MKCVCSWRLDYPFARYTCQVAKFRRRCVPAFHRERQCLTRVPGAGLKSFAATRDEAGSYAMVYVPTGRPFTVRMNKVAGGRVKAWWYNPRTGETTRIGECPNAGERQFIPPTPGENLDWVLVLDDAAKNFPPPGKVTKTRPAGQTRP